MSSDEEHPSFGREQQQGPELVQPPASSASPAIAPAARLSTAAPLAAPETSVAGELGRVDPLSNPRRTSSGDFPGLTVDPACFGVARQAIDTLEEQHQCFAKTAA